MNTVKAFLLLFGYEVGRLKLKYPTNYIDYLPGYKTFIIDKLLHVVSTYIMVVEDCHDYATACTIVRTLIDSVSAYHLVYRRASWHGKGTVFLSDRSRRLSGY